ncbi:FAD-dependent oxidoreductase [Sandaracinobacteroides hominis]|uniref:FAD-dependent oxidoreductase n=1 Tax=Sandaracinobacteroides hominis TaxID=2780086 RepID=UPI0018F2B556|nr:FAD-dependent oxidoreductase [Sandaracinobacteroides hominis]
MSKVVQSRLVQNRRDVLAGIGAMGLAGCAPRVAGQAVLAPGFVKPPLVPIDVRAERIAKITVCLRPFRAAGPRIEAETVAAKRVVHNYGHGGSGWSLSWGSAEVAAGLALEGGARDIAVIGCGAIGLTTALTLQRAGARVTIYAKERAPETRSARATGTWSPDSRVADRARVSADFPDRWERMARASWATHLGYVGTAGNPVFWSDFYILRDKEEQQQAYAPPANAIDFAHYGGRLRDLAPRSRPLTRAEHPFPVAEARLMPSLTFNVAELSHRLMADFLLEGGRIEQMIFETPADLARLKQPVVVNCTGYGARALWKDETITPVRGQIAWLPPQRGVDYSLYYRGVSLLPRPDGIVVQAVGPSEMFGYGDASEVADRAEAEAALAAVAPLFTS